MDITTVIGLVIGIAVVFLAILTGSSLWIFLNIPSILIVLGGTFAATLIKFPLPLVFSAFGIGVRAAFGGTPEKPRDIARFALDLATQTRKGGLLVLEKVEIRNKFLREAIQLCLVGVKPEILRKTLSDEMDLIVRRHMDGSRIFRAIGDSAPAWGMIGTLVGLVQMLSDMQDPKSIGPAMAVALLTTLYGALIANLIAIPIADKLEIKLEAEQANMEMTIEAVMQIQAQQSPAMMEEILQSYMPEGERVSSGEAGKADGAAPAAVPAKK